MSVGTKKNEGRTKAMHAGLVRQATMIDKSNIYLALACKYLLSRVFQSRQISYFGLSRVFVGRAWAIWSSNKCTLAIFGCQAVLGG